MSWSEIKRGWKERSSLNKFVAIVTWLAFLGTWTSMVFAWGEISYSIEGLMKIAVWLGFSSIFSWLIWGFAIYKPK